MNKKFISAILIAAMTLSNSMTAHAENEDIEVIEEDLAEETKEIIEETPDIIEENIEENLESEVIIEDEECESVIKIIDSFTIDGETDSLEIMSVTASRQLYANDLTNPDGPFSVINLLSNYENYENVLASIADTFKDQSLPTSLTIELYESNNVIEDYTIIY